MSYMGLYFSMDQPNQPSLIPSVGLLGEEKWLSRKSKKNLSWNFSSGYEILIWRTPIHGDCQCNFNGRLTCVYLNFRNMSHSFSRFIHPHSLLYISLGISIARSPNPTFSISPVFSISAKQKSHTSIPGMARSTMWILRLSRIDGYKPISVW